MLKKFLFVFATIAMLGLTSCTTTLNSAKQKDFSSSAITATFADLEVSPRKITYTLRPTSEERRGGDINVINTAIRKALEQNGGGDVLVELQTTVKVSRGLFTSKISEVTVSGYPATYKNFRSVDDATLKDALQLRVLQEDPVSRKKLFGIF